MKHTIFIILIIIFGVQQISAQKNDTIPSFRNEQIKKIVNYVKNDNILQLSEIIKYPLFRPNPIPNIENKEVFILYYSTIFDSAFKQKLINANYTKDNTIDTYGFGLFDGDIWLDYDGNIVAINHNSAKELELQNKLIKETKSLMYKSVKSWYENILVCKSDKFIIRIDKTIENGLRFTSWNINKKISDEPDLILYNGIPEAYGNIGGVAYSFKEGNMTYIIENIHILDKNGIYYKLLLNDKEISNIKLEEIK